jgi:hypothetical protein
MPNIITNRDITNQRIISITDIFPLIWATNLQYVLTSPSTNKVNVELWSLIEPIQTNIFIGNIQADGFTITNINIDVIVNQIEVGREIIGAGIPANTYVASIENNNTITISQLSTPANNISCTINRTINSSNTNDFEIQPLNPDVNNGYDYNYIFKDSQNLDIETADITEQHQANENFIQDSWKIKIYNDNGYFTPLKTQKIVATNYTQNGSYFPEDHFNFGVNKTEHLIRNLTSHILNLCEKVKEIEYGMINNKNKTSGVSKFISEISDLTVDNINPKKAPSRLFLNNYDKALQNDLAINMFRIWNANINYKKGSQIKHSTNFQIFTSRKDNNKGNVLNDTEWWTITDGRRVSDVITTLSVSPYYENHPLYIKPIGQYLRQDLYNDLFIEWGNLYGAFSVDGLNNPTFKCPDLSGKKIVQVNNQATDSYQNIGQTVGQDTQTATHSTFRKYNYSAAETNGYDVPVRTSNSFDNRDKAIVGNFYIKALYI